MVFVVWKWEAVFNRTNWGVIAVDFKVFSQKGKFCLYLHGWATKGMVEETWDKIVEVNRMEGVILNVQPVVQQTL